MKRVWRWSPVPQEVVQSPSFSHSETSQSTGHGFTKHPRTSSGGPVTSFPPYCAMTLRSRVRVSSPSPHCSEQVLQDVHSFHSAWIGQKRSWHANSWTRFPVLLSHATPPCRGSARTIRSLKFVPGPHHWSHTLLPVQS